MTDQARKRPAFAVMRVDHYLQASTEDLKELVTVTKIFLTKEEADKEAGRLNLLAAHRGKSSDVEYVVQHARLLGGAQD